MSANISQAQQEYYTMRHALEWNTDFVIIFKACNYDFSTMCRHKQASLAKNRISRERIWAVFGQTLIEFAVFGITAPIAASFKAEAHDVAPLRDRYIKLHHTIDKLLYKLYQDAR